MISKIIRMTTTLRETFPVSTRKELHVRHPQIRIGSQGVVCVNSVYLGSRLLLGLFVHSSSRFHFIHLLGVSRCLRAHNVLLLINKAKAK